MPTRLTGSMLESVDRRFQCQECGMKWFIPAEAPPEVELTECDNCGGELAPFEPEPED